jgi:hypothetical protein
LCTQENLIILEKKMSNNKNVKQKTKSDFSTLVKRAMPEGLESQPFFKFRFKKRTLDPKLAKLVQKMNIALKQRNLTEKAGQLMSVIEESQKADKRFFERGLLRTYAGFIGISVAGGLLAGLASLAVPAAPVVIAIGAAFLGTAYIQKQLYNTRRADRDLSTFGKAVSQKLIVLHKEYPQEVESAPRFKNNKAAIFNLQSVPANEYSYAFKKPTPAMRLNMTARKILSLS